ncbi:MAG: transposase [Pseudomonadota bacterium]
MRPASPGAADPCVPLGDAGIACRAARPELVAEKVETWISAIGAQRAFVAPGSPWENGCRESFNVRFHDELLNRAIFFSLREAPILIGRWPIHDNAVRPRSALGHRPPASDTIIPVDRVPVMH